MLERLMSMENVSMTNFGEIKSRLSGMDIASVETAKTCTELRITFEAPAEGYDPLILRLQKVVVLHLIRQGLENEECPNFTVVEMSLECLSRERVDLRPGLGIQHCFSHGQWREFVESESLIYLQVDGDYWIEAVAFEAALIEPR
jgi:hypothetical protein